MFEKYLNQTCKWSKFVGETDYGEKEYEEEVTLKCRIEMVHDYTQRTEGGVATLNTMYTTTQPIREGDLLDGRVVHKVDAPPMLNGFTPLYWSYVL